MLVCKKCKSLKLEGKWIPSHNFRKNVIFTLCPNCVSEVKQTSQGALLIDLKTFRKNQEGLMQLIQEEENRARKLNVYSRIVAIIKDKNPVMVKTTNSTLAIQIGKQIKRQFQGDLNIIRNPKKEVLVRWSSEEEISLNPPEKTSHTKSTVSSVA